MGHLDDTNPEEGSNLRNMDNAGSDEEEEDGGMGMLDADVDQLNERLDQLHGALDVLEEKNDWIQGQLLALLQSSRELRRMNDIERRACNQDEP